MNQIETLVRAALQEHGVPASDEEVEALVSAYPAFKARLESLYAVTDARHEQPAVSFVPNANVVEW
jgi:hypothetical protein